MDAEEATRNRLEELEEMQRAGKQHVSANPSNPFMSLFGDAMTSQKQVASSSSNMKSKSNILFLSTSVHFCPLLPPSFCTYNFILTP